MTDPNAVMNALYHETTNFEQHTKNEQTAKNRGDTGSGIFDLKNYGNENTNDKNKDNWTFDYNDPSIASSGNLQLAGDIALNNAGYGTGNASFEDIGWAFVDSLNYGGGLILREKDENGNYKTLLGEEFSLAEMGLVLGTNVAFIFVPVPGAGTATKVATKASDAVGIIPFFGKSLKINKIVGKAGKTSEKGIPHKNSNCYGGNCWLYRIDNKTTGIPI